MPVAPNGQTQPKIPRGRQSPRQTHLILLVVGVLVLVVVVGVIVVAMVTHGFRDERSYQAGWAAAGEVRPSWDPGQSSEYLCQHQLDRSKMASDMDWDDFLAGCVDRVRQVIHR
jgi:hypothetical protein